MAIKEMKKRQQILCGKCEYFFVTYNKSKPWGCSRFGFKSQALPSQVVFSTTGINCAYFKKKNVLLRKHASQARNERRQ
tara:strand:+ start:826 stop:1062 length:237 start_codon:yes stop_codon:yes gene_type:complete